MCQRNRGSWQAKGLGIGSAIGGVEVTWAYDDVLDASGEIAAWSRDGLEYGNISP